MIIDLTWLRRARWLVILLALLLVGAFIFYLIARLFYPLPYRDVISRYAEENNLDPLLVAAIIRVESKFNPNARSGKGAIGLMQIMPETGSWVVSRLGIPDFETTDLYDPVMNIKLGTWYLRELRSEFDGSLFLALVAYNGGRRHVKEWISSGKWTGLNADEIPFPETRRFLQRIIRDYRWYRLLYGRGFMERLRLPQPLLPEAVDAHGIVTNPSFTSRLISLPRRFEGKDLG